MYNVLNQSNGCFATGKKKGENHAGEKNFSINHVGVRSELKASTWKTLTP